MQAAGAGAGAIEHGVPGGYGVALLQTLLALAAVCVVAWAVLRWISQRGLAGFGNGARVRVLERVILDGRRTLWLIRIGERELLIGAGEGGAPAVLADVGAERALGGGPPRPAAFAPLLASARGEVSHREADGTERSDSAARSGE